MSAILKQPLNEPEMKNPKNVEKTGCCYKFANSMCNTSTFRLFKTFIYYFKLYFH